MWENTHTKTKLRYLARALGVIPCRARKNMNSEANMMGAKNINIQVQGSYPVISAYEFEFMKELPELQNL